MENPGLKHSAPGGHPEVPNLGSLARDTALGHGRAVSVSSRTPNGDRLQLAGEIRMQELNNELSIVGGTGKYKKARGDARPTRLDDQGAVQRVRLRIIQSPWAPETSRPRVGQRQPSTHPPGPWHLPFDASSRIRRLLEGSLKVARGPERRGGRGCNCAYIVQRHADRAVVVRRSSGRRPRGRRE